MRLHVLIRIAGLAAACLMGVAASTGLPWADASSHKPASHRAATSHGPCVRYDTDDTIGCLPHPITGKTGPRGARGLRGVVGTVGAVGPVGVVGAQGPVGLTGATGPQGVQGIQGIQGIQGNPGAFESGGSDPGGNTIMVVGTKIGPTPFPNGPGTGTELTPSVARCPVAGPDQEAYDG